MEAYSDLGYGHSPLGFAIFPVPHLANPKLQPDALLGGAMCHRWASNGFVCDCRFTWWALCCRATRASDLCAFIRGIHGRAAA
jgi:hypothetical protein